MAGEHHILTRPEAGQSSALPVGPDAKLEFAFDQTNANLGKEGQNLVFTFDDGAKLTLEGFYDNFGDNAQPPTMIVEGNALPGEAFLAMLNNPDLMPAAGPTAAAAMSAGGGYADAALTGVGSVDRLDKLSFDGWGRGTEVPEHYQGVPETPGGSFGLTANSYDTGGMFVMSGMYEDWRPSQHTGDYATILPGRLDFTFAPTGTTVVDAIRLSGFDAGTIIVVGAPQFDAGGNLINGTAVTGPGQTFDFSRSNFDSDGVYVLPPKNSDHDMSISVTLDMHAASSGIRGSVSGSFTIIVDAVADKPVVQAAAFDDLHLTGSVDTVTNVQKKEFTSDGFHTIEQKADGTETVSVTVPFATTVKFEDYTDDSEAHYALIEVPSLPAGASWACPQAVGTITGPDGKEYFQIPVDNKDITAGNGVITVNVQLTVTGDSGTVQDTDLSLKVGGMAEEHPGDGELDLANNIAFDFMAQAAPLKLDVVDGGLKIMAGWASEGNNDAKHLGAASDAYQFTGGEAAATGNAADGVTNTGAPITIEVGVGSSGQPESITSVTFSYDASEGHLFLNGVDLDIYGTGQVTLSGLSGGKLAGLEYRPNTGSFSDADVDVSYTVNVVNAVGVTGSYSGSFTVAVDAVADLSKEVIAGATGQQGNQDYVDSAVLSKDDVNWHDVKGWETDTFKLDYSAVEYGFTVHVSTTFPDTDGSERHYVLVECPSGWSLGTLPSGYTDGGKYTGGDGTTYFKIEVNDSTQSAAVLDVPLYRTGIAGDVNVSLKTGSYVEETVGAGAGREYDLGNNIAVRTDGTLATYNVDVINSKLTVQTGWASEGGMDAKHKYTAEEIASMPSRGNDYALASTNPYAASTSDGKAPITFALSGGDAIGSAEFISSMTFTLGDNAAGKLSLAPGVSGTLTYDAATGVYTYTPATNVANVNLLFTPTKDSFSYEDVGLNYTLTVKNADASASSSYTFSGSSTIVVDAVADMATVTAGAKLFGDGDHLLNPNYDPTDPNSPQFIDKTAARPGEAVTVQGTVAFPDCSGGEKHFILIEDGKTSGDIYTLQSITITDPAGGQSITLSGADLAAALAAGTISTVTIGVATYYRVPMDSEAFQNAFSQAGFTGGDTIGSFALAVTIETVGQTNHSNSVGFGGSSEVGDVPAGTSGGAPGGAASANYEFDTANNVSNNVKAVTVETKIVDTVGLTMSVSNAYENADANAHLGEGQSQALYDRYGYGTTVNSERVTDGRGFVARADMLETNGQFKADYLDSVKASSAAISFSAPAAGEAISALTVRFECLSGVDADKAGNFMYGDTLIYIGDSLTMSNGDMVSCSYDSGSGYITLTIIPADGVYETGSELYFVPGENFRSDDVPLEFAALVRDLASGSTKQFGDAGLAGNLCDALKGIGALTDGDIMEGTPGGATGATVLVDAVAQQAGLVITDADLHSQWSGADGHEYNYLAPGSPAKVNMQIDLRGDVTDSSELHYLLLKAPNGYGITTVEISYLGTDGQQYTATVPASALFLQPAYNDSGAKGTYFAFKFEEYLTEPPAGPLSVSLTMNTPSGAHTGDSIEVGVRTQEDIKQVQTAGDKEIELTNNQANVWVKVELPFSSCSQPGVSMERTWFYENSTGKAHEGDYGLTNSALPISLSLGDANDLLDTLSLTITNRSGSDGRPLGDLWVFKTTADYNAFMGEADAAGADPYAILQQYMDDGKAVNMGGAITLQDLRDNGFVPDAGDVHGKDFTGKVIFMPDAGSYSGQDPIINCHIDLHDELSGQPKSVDHTFNITADAVAQQPVIDGPDLGMAYPAGDHNDLHRGESRTVIVTAKFIDLDVTTDHYFLVEATAGWTVKVGSVEYKDIVTVNGTDYIKIPAGSITPGADDDNSGTATVAITLYPPQDSIFYYSPDTNSYDIHILAGSTDKDFSGKEITFHNNTAIVECGSLSGTLDLVGTGPGEWFFQQTSALYEDNLPDKHLGDTVTEASGHIDIRGPAGGRIVIGVETVKDADGNDVLDSSGDPVPVLNIVGPGVSYDPVAKTYTVDIDANNHAGIDLTLSAAYLANGGQYSDADVNFTSVQMYNADNTLALALGGDRLDVVVDAVADLATGLAGASDYYTGDPADQIGGVNSAFINQDAIVANTAGEGGDCVARFKVEATFADTQDGSERHYILVEQTPMWTMDGASTVYLDGKSYYIVDVTDAAKAGDTSFDVAMTYQGGSSNSGDIFGDYTDSGIVTYQLQVGAMSRESAFDGVEFDLQNNTAINLGGEVTLQYSPVDSSGRLTLSQSETQEWGGDKAAEVIGLNLVINLGPKDELTDFTLSFSPAGGGTLTLWGPGGAEVPFSGTITDPAILLGLVDGTYNFTFTPTEHSISNVSFSWSGTAKNIVSGATATIGAPSTLVIDGLADHSDNTLAVSDQSGNFEGVLNGQSAVVTVTTGFGDTSVAGSAGAAVVLGTEQHWVVLQQLSKEYTVQQVEIYSADGTTLLATIDGADVITKFDDNGRPFYAVEVSSILGVGQGDCQAKFTVNTPDWHDQDHSLTMEAGTFVVEPTVTGDPNLENNWAQNLGSVTIQTAEVQSTTIVVTAEAGDMNEDSGMMQLFFTVPDTSSTNDTIKDLTIKTPDGGSIFVNGVEHASGDVTITAADLGSVYFQPDAYWSGHVNVVITGGTLTDLTSGAEKAATVLTPGGFDVIGVANAPASVTESVSSTMPVGSGEAVIVTVAVEGFVDLDGSEKHYVLVQKEAGWECPQADGTYEASDGTVYFKVPVDGNQADVTQDVTLIAPKDYVVGEREATLKVGGLAQEQAPGSDNTAGFTPGGSVTVDIKDTATLSLVNNNPPDGVVEGGALSFTLTLADGAQPFTATDPLSVLLKLSFPGGGIDPASADDLTLTGWATSDGGVTYTLTLTLPSFSSSTNLTIPTVKDGILEHSEGVRVEILSYDLGTLGANITVPASTSYDVTIRDAGGAIMVLEQLSASSMVEGSELGFTLNLQNSGTHAAMTAVEALVVSFIVSGFNPETSAASHLSPTLFTAGTDSHGNVWAYNGDGAWTVTSTLLPGQSSLTVNTVAALSNGQAGVIDAAEGLRFALDPASLTTLTAHSCTIVADGVTIASGSHLDFTVADADYTNNAALLAQHGITSAAEADGKVLVQLSPDGDGNPIGAVHDGSLETLGQVVIGTEHPDTIYASQGNDILIGGAGNDTFVWNSDNMGKNDTSATDVIKDFQPGDILRFESLFSDTGGASERGNALETLLNSGGWDPATQSFIADDGSTSIQLSVTDTVATLTVSYTDGSNTYTQNVELQGFDAAHSLADANSADVALMLRNIIEVGG
ncbi:MAG: hypothetical protein LBC79_09320 [Deltaproteobacteria bacterium]|jgi:hypothetical protein|nr:hypothetical protein [Deltaproteobacteria bacterium]